MRYVENVSQFDQELYDRVTIAVMQALISNSTINLKSTSDQKIVKVSFNIADAFMAERENRLKG
jgi:hypothetical protein